MNKIKYQKASLFDAPEGSLIVHAVNCQGVWGSGIAKEFKKRYPKAFKTYKTYCEIYKRKTLGEFFIDFTEYHKVGGLYTSYGYGENVDSPEKIKLYTACAVNSLLNSNLADENISVIYSNKFNSGLFNVPWEETEEIINTFLENHPEIEWIVMDPELEE